MGADRDKNWIGPSPFRGRLGGVLAYPITRSTIPTQFPIAILPTNSAP